MRDYDRVVELLQSENRQALRGQTVGPAISAPWPGSPARLRSATMAPTGHLARQAFGGRASP